MRFMCLINYNEAEMAKATPEEMKQFGAEWGAFNQALAKAGSPGERLEPSRAATTVRVKNGKADVLDGPYADTKEQFAGYFMLDVADLDAAIEFAKTCPGARYGSIEIRPFWQAPAGQSW